MKTFLLIILLATTTTTIQFVTSASAAAADFNENEKEDQNQQERHIFCTKSDYHSKYFLKIKARVANKTSSFSGDLFFKPHDGHVDLVAIQNETLIINGEVRKFPQKTLKQHHQMEYDDYGYVLDNFVLLLYKYNYPIVFPFNLEPFKDHIREGRNFRKTTPFFMSIMYSVDNTKEGFYEIDLRPIEPGDDVLIRPNSNVITSQQIIGKDDFCIYQHKFYVQVYEKSIEVLLKFKEFVKNIK